MRVQDVKAEIASILGADITVTADNSFTADIDGCSLGQMLALCGLLECSPEHLYTSYDGSRAGGGCDTCGYGSGTAEMEFEVRR